MSAGYVYVLSNPAFDWLKIGYSKNGGVERAIALSKDTGVPLPYRCEYELEVDDARRVESCVHRDLAEYRISDSREFFSCSFEIAVACIKSNKNQKKTPVALETQQEFDNEIPEFNSLQIHYDVVDILARRLCNKAFVMLVYMLRHGAYDDFTRRELSEDAGAQVGREEFFVALNQLISERIITDNNDGHTVLLNKKMFFGGES